VTATANALNKTSSTNEVIAGLLGWTFDAFDFFVLTLVLPKVAADFNVSVPKIALTITLSLAMRPVGAIIFGLMADKYGRRVPMMLNVVYFSLIEVLSGLAPNYTAFLILRILFGIGMGGEWGVGASLVMESIPAKWRGLISGILQEGYAMGFLLAAAVYRFAYPAWGWRSLFFIGGLPALLTLFIRARVKESDVWHESRARDWGAYKQALLSNGKRFGYLVLLMTMMNFISHGTQDMFPTYLEKARGFGPDLKALTTIISMIGALAGGILFGHYSERIGRRRAMVTSISIGLLVIPLWMFAPTVPLIWAGAFAMQFAVQGAFGVVPVHINELSPNELRGFFPGFAYQMGVLFSSSMPYIESLLAERLGYAATMGSLAAIVFIGGIIVISLGPEAKGIAFGKSASSHS
jgi:SHS family lactate transporter-like MFS transporter